MSSTAAGVRCALHSAPRTLGTTSLRANGPATTAATAARAVRSLHSSPTLRPQSVLRAQLCSTTRPLGLFPQRQLLPPSSPSSHHFHTVTRLLSQSAAPPSQSLVNYAIAAAYSAKHHRFSPNNAISYEPSLPPTLTRREKKARPKSGEDSFFISDIDTAPSVAFGVVDGVGGWTSSGVDPADFAHGLCEYMAIAAKSWPEWEAADASITSITTEEHAAAAASFTAVAPGDVEGLEPLRPVELLQEGFDRVLNDRTIFAGGSTACVAIAAPSGRVEVAK